MALINKPTPISMRHKWCSECQQYEFDDGFDESDPRHRHDPVRAGKEEEK